MESSSCLVTFLTIITICNGLIFIDNHQYEYEYRARMEVGVFGHEEPKSSFAFHAILELRSHGNATFARLPKLTCDSFMSNSSLPRRSDMKAIAETLGLPFAIIYDDNGTIGDILTDEKDPLWSINIKRGIASMWQLDSRALVSSDDDRSFITQENSVYGRCPVSYAVSQEVRRLGIDKQIDYNKCANNSWRSGDTRTPINIFGERKYFARYTDGKMIIDSINSENTIYSSPSTGGTNIQVTKVKQYFNLIDITEINETSAPTTANMSHHQLEMNFIADKKIDYDLTGGKLSPYNSVNIKDLKRDIEDWSLIFQPNFKFDATPLNQGNVMHSIVSRLELLHESQLNDLMIGLSENYKAADIFYEILPFIGTPASIMLIKNLLLSGKLEPLVAEKLVENLPSNWKHPNSELLIEFLPLLQPDSKLRQGLRKNLLLAVASMLSRLHYVENNTQIEELLKFYIDAFETSTSDRIMWILCMKNMNFKVLTPHLESFIKGKKENITAYERSLAIWAAKEFHSRDEEIIEMLYLPILANETESVHVRCAALDVYLTFASVEKLLRLSKIMKSEKYTEVYSSYISLIESIAASKSPKERSIANFAKKILQKSAPRSGNAVSVQRVVSYYDERSDITKKISIAITGNIYLDDFATIYIDPIMEITDVLNTQESVFIRVQISDDELKSGRVNNTHRKKYFPSALADIFTYGSATLDLIIVKNGKVSTYYKDMSLSKMLAWFDTKGSFDVLWINKMESLIPTDFGIPVMYFTHKYKRDVFHFHALNVEENEAPLFIFKFHTILTNCMLYGLRFYNPMSDLWHGVKRNHVMNTNIPINLSVTKDFTVFIDDTKKGQIEVAGFESFVHTDVFLEDYGANSLCSSCSKSLKINGDKNKLEQVTVWKNACKSTGRDYQFQFFDCERKINQNEIADIRNEIINDITRSWLHSEIEHKMLSLQSLFQNAFLMSNFDTCGIRFLSIPKYPRSKLSTKYGRENSSHKFAIEYSMSETDDEESGLSWSFESNSVFLQEIPSINSSTTFLDNLGNEELETLFEGGIKFENFSLAGDISILTKYIDDSTSLKVSLKGEISEEQRNSRNFEKELFDTCVAKKSSIECAEKITYLRNYEYEITYENLSDDFITMWRRGTNLFQTLFSNYIVYTDKVEDVSPKTVRIAVNLPLFTDTVNVKVMTESDTHVYKGIPLENFLFKYIFPPISSHYKSPGIMRIFQEKKMTTCSARKDFYINTANVKVSNTLTSNWTRLASDCELQDDETYKFCTYEVFAKWTPETNLALRVTSSSGTTEVSPSSLNTLDVYKNADGERMKLFWKDDKLEVDQYGYYWNENFIIKIIDTPRMLLSVKRGLLNIDFTGSLIRIHFDPDVNINTGLCK